MATARATLPDLDTLNAEALKTLILAQHAQLLAHETEIEHLKLLVAKLQRLQFGRKSERLSQQIERKCQDWRHTLPKSRFLSRPHSHNCRFSEEIGTVGLLDSQTFGVTIVLVP